MTIEKLPSGKYRAKIMQQGKTYRITYDYRPSKREAESDLMHMIEEMEGRKNGKATFRDCAQKYVEMKSNVLSPSTSRGYVSVSKSLSPWFMNKEIDSVTQVDINKQINEYALNHAPKTVHNLHGFISAVLTTFRPDLHIYTTLPQKRKSERYTPSDDEVRQLLEYFRKTNFYVPLILACWGMRRSEILALTPDDVEADGTVHITKAMVQDKDGNMVIKSTKTTDSTRDIIIPLDVANMIREKGCVYNGYHNQISDRMSEVQKKLGMNHFTIHALRHYFCTRVLPEVGEKATQEMGGWKTSYVMKSVYEHLRREEKEKSKRNASDILSQSILHG